jgi:tryptophan-rich sensory protein
MITKKSNRLDGQKIAWIIFECTMSVLYLGFGVVLLGTSIFESVFYGGIRIALGIVIGLYGIFRIYRAAKKVIRRNE